MSSTNERPDEFQQIWQEDNDPIQKEKISVIMTRVQETGRSYFELVDSGLRKQLRQALFVAPAAIFIATRTSQLAPRIGWSLIAALAIFTAVDLFRRIRNSSIPKPEQIGRAYCLELVRLTDQRIRSTAQAQWYLLPLLVLSVGLLVWPYMGVWGSVFLSGGTVLVWLSMRRENVGVVVDLRRRKQEVLELLQEMDRA